MLRILCSFSYEPFVKTIEMRGLNGGECVARVRSDLASGELFPSTRNIR